MSNEYILHNLPQEKYIRRRRKDVQKMKFCVFAKNQKVYLEEAIKQR